MCQSCTLDATTVIMVHPSAKPFTSDTIDDTQTCAIRTLVCDARSPGGDVLVSVGRVFFSIFYYFFSSLIEMILVLLEVRTHLQLSLIAMTICNGHCLELWLPRLSVNQHNTTIHSIVYLIKRVVFKFFFCLRLQNNAFIFWIWT